MLPELAAPKERRLVALDERCTVAALCRGLRFDGDITLKEVALAFQLRDAYDWDEDLEAAVKVGVVVWRRCDQVSSLTLCSHSHLHGVKRGKRSLITRRSNTRHLLAASTTISRLPATLCSTESQCVGFM